MGILFSIFASIFLSVSAVLVPFTEVKKGFETNNAGDVVALCTEKIFINVNGEQNVYSQSQAQLVLKKLFTKNPCKNFSYIFKGEDADAPTAIAKIIGQNESYTLNLQFKKIGNKFYIQSIVL